MRVVVGYRRQLHRNGHAKPFAALVIAALLAVVAGTIAALVSPESGAARERRFLMNDRFELEVGFLSEPPYQGQPNGLYLRVIDFQPPTPTPTPDPAPTPTPDPNASPTPEPTPPPVTEIRAEVRYADQTRELSLVRNAEDPTLFRAEFVPSQPGDYTFRIFGMLDGVEFSEEFHSSGTTFPGVIDTAGNQFPIGIPAGQALVDAQAETDERINRARTFGIVGIALGVFGVLAGGISVVMARRPPPPGRTDPLPPDSSTPAPETD